MNLRPYQLSAIEAVREAMRAGCNATLLVCPTGGGKTIIASRLAQRCIELGTRMLFVAHRRELISQAFAKFARAGIPLSELGIIMANVASERGGGLPIDLTGADAQVFARHGRRRPAATIQVASLDTLRNRAMPEADLIIIDEAHRSLAASYVALRAKYPNAVFLGLTATPCRADNKPLGDQWSEMVIVSSPRELCDDGFLVEPRVWTTPYLPDLSAVGVQGGDYNASQLGGAMNKSSLVGDIVDHWKRRGNDNRTICFAASVEHSQKIVAAFIAEGISAEHVDGKTKAAERDAIFARLLSGATTVVSNVGVATEGWDCPPVKTLILARPTKSLALFLQMAGRILRPWNDVGAIILDHAGACGDHGLPLRTREWSLEAQKKRSTKGGGFVVPTVRTCLGCYAISDASATCCISCGLAFPEVTREPEEVDGELVEARELTESETVANWKAMCVKEFYEPNERRAMRGQAPIKPGIVWVKWHKRFHSGIPKGQKLPVWTEEERERWERANRKPEEETTRAERAERIQSNGQATVPVLW